jgi:hypothetical protein
MAVLSFRHAGKVPKVFAMTRMEPLLPYTETSPPLLTLHGTRDFSFSSPLFGAFSERYARSGRSGSPFQVSLAFTGNPDHVQAWLNLIAGHKEQITAANAADLLKLCSEWEVYGLVPDILRAVAAMTDNLAFIITILQECLVLRTLETTILENVLSENLDKILAAKIAIGDLPTAVLFRIFQGWDCAATGDAYPFLCELVDKRRDAAPLFSFVDPATITAEQLETLMRKGDVATFVAEAAAIQLQKLKAEFETRAAA